MKQGQLAPIKRPKDRDQLIEELSLNLGDPNLQAKRLLKQQRYSPSVGFKICKGRRYLSDEIDEMEPELKEKLGKIGRLDVHCELALRCPLLLEGKEVPEGAECPVEKSLYSMWASDLAEEFGVSPEDVTDIGQIKDIAWVMLEEWRAQQIAADSPLMIDSLRAFTPQGVELTEPKLHPVHHMLEKLANKKQKLLDSLMATRSAKSKDRTNRTIDANDTLQNMVKVLKTIRDTGYTKELPTIDPDPVSAMGITAKQEEQARKDELTEFEQELQNEEDERLQQVPE